MKAKFGSAAYAMKELRAELSSAFLAGELGIPADIPYGPKPDLYESAMVPP
jgi:hypothetical protein